MRHGVHSALSAAETECLTPLAGELGYLPRAVVQDLESTLVDTTRALHGLLRTLTHTAS